MNTNAEKLKQYLDENLPDAFQLADSEDGAVTYFQSAVEIEGKPYPIMAFVDETMYTPIKILVAAEAVNRRNKAAVLERLNDINARILPFKYFVDEKNNIVFLGYTTTWGDTFNPAVVHGSLLAMLDNLKAEYKAIMKALR